MTSTKIEFQNDLKFGIAAEDIFVNYLLKQGKHVFNPGIKEYDLETLDGIKYEIKRDRYTKNNNRIAVEIWSNRRLYNLGWIYYTKADILIYFISETEFYEIDMKHLREIIEITKGYYDEKVCSVSGNMDSWIYSIPISDLGIEYCKKKVIT